MNATTIDCTQQAAERCAGQGYCSAGERPQCSNCWAASPGFVSKGLAGQRMCSYGGFAVDDKGWCPIWIPTTAWIDGNPSAAKSLGVALGHGPATTAGSN
jgi:hypothetical protein